MPPYLLPGTSFNLYPLEITHLPLAGRLKHCIPNWGIVSGDPWVLETVQGYYLDFVAAPHQSSLPLPVLQSKEN